MVVVVYNMAREAPRTLHSLSAGYQRHIKPDDYEVIVVDNGSNPPLDPKVIEGLAGNFRLIRIDDASPSPAQAVNRGLAEARGEVIGVMIDGARIATPGMLHFARHGARLYERAVVATLGWYLGYDLQRWAMRAGYNQACEDALLESIGWPQDGYRLFDIATMDESSIDGWLAPISESNGLFLGRELWDVLGGMDVRFDLAGGGLINLDTLRRVLELPNSELVLLLGEATFHQLHGGTATNARPEMMQENWNRWASQYETIRGLPYQLPPIKTPTYLGVLPRGALARFARAAIDPVWTGRFVEPPLGPCFDGELWSHATPAQSTDTTIATLVDLADNHFRGRRYEAAAAISRLIREKAPAEPEPQRLLSLIGSWLLPDGPSPDRRAEYYCALAEAHSLLGENEAAAANYRAALTFDSNLAKAHVGLSALRMPGDSYLVWLERLYGSLVPETVIEIGIYKGNSLALLQPPTVAIGIDPAPTVTFPLKTETHIFAETSDEFFARHRPETLLAGRSLSVAFIDGLHLYEQALRDFIHLEACCGPRSVILFHDTVPLDQLTQSRTPETAFYTGDVWKTVLCLKHYRPDLDIFTIATSPTGLTVVTGLDPTSSVLTEKYDEAVARFIGMPFSEIENRLDEAFNIVPNDWSIVQSRLKERGIL